MCSDRVRGVYPWVKKWPIPKVIPRPAGMYKQVVLRYSEPFSTQITPMQVPKKPKKGYISAEKGAKKSKTYFFQK